MSAPILPQPGGQRPEAQRASTGEGSQTALAAMLHRRKMGENHVDDDVVDDDVTRDIPRPQE